MLKPQRVQLQGLRSSTSGPAHAADRLAILDDDDAVGRGPLLEGISIIGVAAFGCGPTDDDAVAGGQGAVDGKGPGASPESRTAVARFQPNNALNLCEMSAFPPGFDGLACFGFLNRFTYGNFGDPNQFGLEC